MAVLPAFVSFREKGSRISHVVGSAFAIENVFRGAISIPCDPRHSWCAQTADNTFDARDQDSSPAIPGTVGKGSPSFLPQSRANPAN